MRPHIVVDVGNTRIKWGVCALDGSGVLRSYSLPYTITAWAQQLRQLADEQPLASVAGPLSWALASVQPVRGARLSDWLRIRGDKVISLERAAQLPLTVRLPHPDRVGIDRLLNAVAAKRRLAPGQPAVLIDAGSAVTVDWMDEKHAFRGGAIFPGLRLMAKALHDYAAMLPQVTIDKPATVLPADDTISAIEVGIFQTAAGGIERMARQLAEQGKTPAAVFLTGGDAALLHEALTVPRQPTLWQHLTLEGILHSAEALSP